MASSLGVRARLVAALGGETGEVLAGLVEREGVGLRAIPTPAANGGYVQDRRGGERRTLVDMTPGQLSRHDVDELYGSVLVDALEAGVCVLTGPPADGVLPADVYERLTADLSGNGCLVVADLSGESLAAALRAGGLSVLKVGHDEVVEAELAEGDSVEQLVAAVERLAAAGVEDGRRLAGRAARPRPDRRAGRRSPAAHAAGRRPPWGRGLHDRRHRELAGPGFQTGRRREGRCCSRGPQRDPARLGTGRRWQVEELSRRVEMREVR